MGSSAGRSRDRERDVIRGGACGGAGSGGSLPGRPPTRGVEDVALVPALAPALLGRRCQPQAPIMARRCNWEGKSESKLLRPGGGGKERGAYESRCPLGTSFRCPRLESLFSESFVLGSHASGSLEHGLFVPVHRDATEELRGSVCPCFDLCAARGGRSVMPAFAPTTRLKGLRRRAV